MQTDLDLLRVALAATPSEAEALARALDEGGGLLGLFRAPSEERGLPRRTRARLVAWAELVARLLEAPLPPDRIDGAEGVAAYFRPRLALSATESFWVLMLDARGRVLGRDCVAEGTLTACLVHPREVFAPAIRLRAAQIVVVHNHPSGDPTPSPEDLLLTERLTVAGDLLGIPVVDHVVVARRGHRSLGSPAPRSPRPRGGSHGGLSEVSESAVYSPPCPGSDSAPERSPRSSWP